MCFQYNLNTLYYEYVDHSWKEFDVDLHSFTHVLTLLKNPIQWTMENTLAQSANQVIAMQGHSSPIKYNRNQLININGKAIKNNVTHMKFRGISSSLVN